MLTSTRLDLANLVSFRRARGERVMGLRTHYSEYLVLWVSRLEIQVIKVSFNEGAVQTGEVSRGNEFRLESHGPFLRLQLLKDGSHVLTTSVIHKIIGLDDFIVQP